jgi:hypothetical protein
MTWYKLKLPEYDLPAMLRMIKFFQEQYIKHRMPKGAALLINDSPNRIDPVVGDNWFYFTPIAAKICQQMLVIEGGQPCSEPPFEESSYLGGDESYMDDQRRQKLPDKPEETG